MLKRLAIAGALACACAAPAHAWHRHHHHHARPHASHRDFQASWGARPAAWCGWWLGRLLGLHDRSLWLARNWAHVGSPSRAVPGAVVVWPHHVGQVKAVKAGKILVHSGNDGHAVRTRWRSMRGVIAFRRL